MKRCSTKEAHVVDNVVVVDHRMHRVPKDGACKLPSLHGPTLRQPAARAKGEKKCPRVGKSHPKPPQPQATKVN